MDYLYFNALGNYYDNQNIGKSNSLNHYFKTEYSDVIVDQNGNVIVPDYLLSSSNINKKLVLKALKSIKKFLEKEDDILTIGYDSKAYLYFASEYQQVLKHNNSIIVPTK